MEGLCRSRIRRRARSGLDRLITLARRVYPDLGRRAHVRVGTPRTFERFTGRPRGAVGGFRQTLFNSNQNAIPHDLGVRGFFLAGDTTWPGLGTVACVLGSRVVANLCSPTASSAGGCRNGGSGGRIKRGKPCHAVHGAF